MREQRAKGKDKRANGEGQMAKGEGRSPVPDGTGQSKLSSEKGIALVMVLVLSFISLAVVSALLYMVTQGTIFSGSHGFFRTAEDASFGGTEIVKGYIDYRGTLNIPALAGVNFTAGCNCEDPYIFTDNVDLMTGAVSCRCDKLCNPTAAWPVSCDEDAGSGFVSLDPTSPLTRIDGTDAFDMSFALGSFTVFAKIVDTVQGSSDVGGITTDGEGGGKGVVVSDSGILSPPLNPYLYRIEVQAQATINPREVSRLSVLYAY